VFIFTFLGIKRMCNLPVESMTTGGILWFHDLTVADPTFILPTLSLLSILAVVYVI
jgi:YidC/Oxa1 family membrane protein insertase